MIKENKKTPNYDQSLKGGSFRRREKKFRFRNRFRSNNNIGCYVSNFFSNFRTKLVRGFRGFSSASGLTSFAKRIIHRELVFKPPCTCSSEMNGISD